MWWLSQQTSLPPGCSNVLVAPNKEPSFNFGQGFFLFFIFVKKAPFLAESKESGWIVSGSSVSTKNLLPRKIYKSVLKLQHHFSALFECLNKKYLYFNVPSAPVWIFTCWCFKRIAESLGNWMSIPFLCIYLNVQSWSQSIFWLNKNHPRAHLKPLKL